VKRVSLDKAQKAVKQFIRDLPIDSEGVEIELDGKVVCEVLPPHAVTPAERTALIARGRELVQRARVQNKGVPAAVLEREVGDAVDEARRRKQP